jgi:hypothetical protein
VGVVVHDSEVPGCAMRRFKAVCDLPHAPAFVLAALNDTASRVSWDHNIAACEVRELQSTPFRAALLHSQTHPFGPISGRDFVDLPVFLSFEAASQPFGPEAFVVPAGSIVSGGIGVETDARFPVTGGSVRGVNYEGSGWLFEPLAGGAETRLHYVIHTNVKGWIPCALVNSNLAASYVLFFKDLKINLEARARSAAAADAADDASERSSTTASSVA